MRMKKGVQMLAVVLVLVSVLGLGLTGHAKEASTKIKLRHASYLPAGIPCEVLFAKWMEEVTKRTDGNVVFETYYAGSLLKAADLLKGARDGLADTVTIATGYYPSELALTTVFELLYVTSKGDVPSLASGEMLKTFSPLKQEYQKLGVKALYLTGFNNSNLYTKKPVRTPADVKGWKIRGFGWVNKAIEKWGANPVAIPSPDVYMALERGTIDATSGIDIQTLETMKIKEVAPNIIDVGMGSYVLFITVMNQKKFDSLSAKYKKVIEEVNAEAPSWLPQVYEKVNRNNFEKIAGSVQIVELTDAERAQWKNAVVPSLWDEWKAEMTKRGYSGAPAAFDAYMQLVKKYEPQSKWVNEIELLREIIRKARK